MAFISSTQVGTLIFDSIQQELSTYLEVVAHALNDYFLTQEEITLIAKDLSKASSHDKSSKENLINYFAYEAEHTPNIIKKYIVLANQGLSPLAEARI